MGEFDRYKLERLAKSGKPFLAVVDPLIGDEDGDHHLFLFAVSNRKEYKSLLNIFGVNASLYGMEESMDIIGEMAEGVSGIKFYII